MLKSCNYTFTPYLQRKKAKFNYKIIPMKNCYEAGGPMAAGTGATCIQFQNTPEEQRK